MTEKSIAKQIGKPEKIDFRKPKVIGSTGFYLKSFHAKHPDAEHLKLNSRCNFEKRPDGILLRANYSNALTAIPIPKETIIEITLKRGEETIDPMFPSPMWILLKLGVSVVYARYLRLWLAEYSIDQMEVHLKTTAYDMHFIANGYLFERQLKFFEGLNYGRKLKSI